MRVFSLALVLTAAAALAPPVSAQPTAPATPTPYGRAGLGVGYGGGGTGFISAPSVAVGVRLPSGLEVGGYVTRVGYGTQSSVVAFGPEVRAVHALSPTTTLNVYASGSVGFSSDDRIAADLPMSLGTTLEATVTRRFGLGRGIDLATTAGAYASAFRLSRLNGSDLTDPDATFDNRLGTQAGVLAGVQFEFDALGGRVGIGPSGGLPLVGSDGAGPLSAVPYLGATRNRGFVTFSF